jgi:hypothetical protein
VLKAPLLKVIDEKPLPVRWLCASSSTTNDVDENGTRENLFNTVLFTIKLATKLTVLIEKFRID